MKKALILAAVAALAVAGCKKKNAAGTDTGSGTATAMGSGTATMGGGTAAATGSGTAATTPPAGGMTCDGLGGTKEGDICFVKKAPFTAVFTGKYDTDMMHPDEPGAMFKVTNTLDVPVAINTAQLYAYDKAGTQLDITAGGSKSKYVQDSMGGLIKLEAKETKEYRHSVGKDMLPPEVDSLQLEFPSWYSADDKDHYELKIDDMEVRPKDGWK